MTLRKKVLFIVPYPLHHAPSQRFRFEQYFGALRANSIEYEVQTFLTPANWRVFYNSGNSLRKAFALLLGFLRRTVGILGAWRFEYVFVHREAAPIGPPVFEWIFAKLFKKKVIYDFDDAIWLTDVNNESSLNRIIKNRGKVSTICKWAICVSCGNAYLAKYASRFNKNVSINPTTIDMEPSLKMPMTSKNQTDDSIVIGWTGSHSTLKYLTMLECVLRRIELEFSNISFIVIADKAPTMRLDRMKFVAWSASSEMTDLSKIDIGIMPLPDDEWAKGKCGFKILQYMSLQIPSVSSAVGTNNEIVTHGENGFLCRTDEEWFDCLKLLIEDRSLRNKFGKLGRETVSRRYSVNSNTPAFLSLFV